VAVRAEIWSEVAVRAEIWSKACATLQVIRPANFEIVRLLTISFLLFLDFHYLKFCA
jgi:hypothetical protein